MLRPEPRVLADGALVPDANVISPPPNRFTHELVRDVPYRLDRPARAHEPDGVLEAGSSVVLLVDGPELCWVVDASGLYVEVSRDGPAPASRQLSVPPPRDRSGRATRAGPPPDWGRTLHLLGDLHVGAITPDRGALPRPPRRTMAEPAGRSGRRAPVSTGPTSAPSARDASPAAEQVSRRLPARACGRPLGCAADPFAESRVQARLFGPTSAAPRRAREWRPRRLARELGR